MGNLKRIFISYGRSDAANFARKLADWLRDQQYEPWLDVDQGIPIGAPFDVRPAFYSQKGDFLKRCQLAGFSKRGFIESTKCSGKF